jgi:exodeoxyribonuclease V alpha subunit
MSSSLDTDKFHHVSSVLHQLSQKNGLPNIEQLQAIEASCRKKFSIITGGPGTGKTTTVTLLLWALYYLYGSDLSVKICAPTGKAAVRVRDSILNSIERLRIDGNGLVDVSCFAGLINDNSNFGTIHKLLGTQSRQIYFRHNHKNQLEQQVLIIDESSMVGLPLFSKLLDAVNSSTIQHIIFLGDKNQLSLWKKGMYLPHW